MKQKIITLIISLSLSLAILVQPVASFAATADVTISTVSVSFNASDKKVALSSSITVEALPTIKAPNQTLMVDVSLYSKSNKLLGGYCVQYSLKDIKGRKTYNITTPISVSYSTEPVYVKVVAKDNRTGKTYTKSSANISVEEKTVGKTLKYYPGNFSLCQKDYGNSYSYNGKKYQMASMGCWLLSYSIGESIVTGKTAKNPVTYAANTACDLKGGLAHKGSKTSFKKTNAVYQTLYRELQAGHPVMLDLGKHMVLLIGVKGGVALSKLDASSLIIYDPLTGSTSGVLSSSQYFKDSNTKNYYVVK